MPTYIPLPVDIRDHRRMNGLPIYVENNNLGTCSKSHQHPVIYMRVHVIFGELVHGDPTMDGYNKDY